MKRGTPNHPKVYELAAHLDVPRYAAVGILESLFHFAQGYAQSGDIGRHTDEAIARAIGWEGNAATLISALAKAGWVDRCSCHRVRIHDWPDHADQTLKRSEAFKKQGFLGCYGDASRKLAGDEQNASQPSRAVAVAGPTPTPPPGQAGPAPPARPPAEGVERYGPVGEAEELRREIKAALRTLAEGSGQPQDELLALHSNTGRGALVNVDGCASVPWLRVTRDRLKAALLLLQAGARAGPTGRSPTAGERTVAAVNDWVRAKQGKRGAG